jgi:hypothetical protein
VFPVRYELNSYKIFRRNSVLESGRLSEPSDRKIRSSVPWDWEPRFTALARASRNVSFNQSVSLEGLSKIFLDFF